MCGEEATISDIIPYGPNIPYGHNRVCYELNFDNHNINEVASAYMISADMIEHYDN
jgi:hypothetical protein